MKKNIEKSQIKKIIQCMDSDEEIIEFMELLEDKDYKDVCVESARLLKNEENVMHIIKKINYDTTYSCNIISYLKSEDNLMEIIRQTIKGSPCSNLVYGNGIGRVTSEKNILEIIEKSEYDKRVCRSGIKRLKSKKIILDIMKKVDYDDFVCEAALERIEKIKEIERAKEKLEELKQEIIEIETEFENES